MGWFDDVVNTVTGNPIMSALGAIPGGVVGSYASGYLGQVLGPHNGLLVNEGQGGPGLASRKKLLRDNVVTDKEIDDITRELLLREIDTAGFGGPGGVIPPDQLANFEKILSEAKSGQSDLYKARRSVSAANKSRKETPGLAAQTMLTSNTQGAARAEGMAGGGSLLT